MNKLNRIGPRFEPWGTPDKSNSKIRVTTGAGKAGKQVYFSVWKAGKAGISKIFN